MRLNPFVQVFYSNKKNKIVLTKNYFCLNPFVQVFYSNIKEIEENGYNWIPGLNPFVQVFYSNLIKLAKSYLNSSKS